MTTKTKLTEAKHTPGPWHAEGIKDGDGYLMGGDYIEVVVLADDMVKDQICSIALDTGEDTPDDRATVAEAEANARLIAAAPMMLEALREADAALDLAECRCSGDFECSPCKATAAVYGAIELATQSPEVAK